MSTPTTTAELGGGTGPTVERPDRHVLASNGRACEICDGWTANIVGGRRAHARCLPDAVQPADLIGAHGTSAS